MIEIYKYGGNLLKDENTRKVIYEFLKTKNELGIKVIMVVSAFGREKDNFSTDNLAKNIELLNNKDKDQIMTFGEIYSSLIIKNELLREGIKVDNLYYDEIGINCDDTYQNGNIESVDMSYLETIIRDNDVVVVPGFIGKSSEGKIISLGRNTSDLTAVVIAKYFNLNKVNIIKEVNGVFKKDPKKEKTNKFINKLSYDEMMGLVNAGSTMFSMKTLRYAKDNGIVIEVKGLEKDSGTIISDIKSDEDILFIDEENDTIKVVFKDMEVFNELFRCLVEGNIKIDDLVIVNNVFYFKGNKSKFKQIIAKCMNKN
jgi:aspartate kinase